MLPIYAAACVLQLAATCCNLLVRGGLNPPTRMSCTNRVATCSK